MSTTKKIVAFARKKLEGFKAADVKHFAKGKSPSNVYVALAELKKKGVLTHDAATGIYKLGESMVNSKTVRVTAPALKPIRDTATSNMIDRMMRELRMADEKYQDSLAIIRYLESKLVTAIQHDARSQG